MSIVDVRRSLYIIGQIARTYHISVHYISSSHLLIFAYRKFYIKLAQVLLDKKETDMCNDAWERRSRNALYIEFDGLTWLTCLSPLMSGSSFISLEMFGYENENHGLPFPGLVSQVRSLSKDISWSHNQYITPVSKSLLLSLAFQRAGIWSIYSFNELIKLLRSSQDPRLQPLSRGASLLDSIAFAVVHLSSNLTVSFYRSLSPTPLPLFFFSFFRCLHLSMQMSAKCMLQKTMPFDNTWPDDHFVL